MDIIESIHLRLARKKRQVAHLKGSEKLMALGGILTQNYRRHSSISRKQRK
jgi:hypothetical protein